MAFEVRFESRVTGNHRLSLESVSKKKPTIRYKEYIKVVKTNDQGSASLTKVTFRPAGLRLQPRSSRSRCAFPHCPARQGSQGQGHLEDEEGGGQLVMMILRKGVVMMILRIVIVKKIACTLQLR